MCEVVRIIKSRENTCLYVTYSLLFSYYIWSAHWPVWGIFFRKGILYEMKLEMLGVCLYRRSFYSIVFPKRVRQYADEYTAAGQNGL